MKDFEFEIIQHLSVLSTSRNGWKKEINIVSYNGSTPKYDIRDWSPDHSRMAKGVTLTAGEAASLVQALRERLKRPLPGKDDPCIHDCYRGDIRIQVYESLCVLSIRNGGWRKEATITAWNEGTPKVEIRSWTPGYGHMTRGISLSAEEAKALSEADIPESA